MSVEALVTAVALAMLLDSLAEGLQTFDVLVEERAIVTLHAPPL